MYNFIAYNAKRESPSPLLLSNIDSRRRLDFYNGGTAEEGEYEGERWEEEHCVCVCVSKLLWHVYFFVCAVYNQKGRCNMS